MPGIQRIAVFAPLAVLLALVAIFAMQLDDDPSVLPSALINKPVPAFDLPTLSTREPATQTLLQSGEVQLINVFASWCLPCWSEHALIGELASEGVPIIGWAYKDTPKAITRFLDRLGNPYRTVVLDETGLSAINLGVYGAPETYIVDGNGIIRYRYVGALTKQAIRDELKPLIASLGN